MSARPERASARPPWPAGSARRLGLQRRRVHWPAGKTPLTRGWQMRWGSYG